MQGTCLHQSVAVWCARKPKLPFHLVLRVVAVQLQQSAFRQGTAPLPLKWLWNRGHATTSTYHSWLRLLQNSLCYLAWLLSALQNWWLQISFGSIAGTLISRACPLMLHTVKRSKRPAHQSAAVLWQSYSCCFIRLEILLDMLQSPSVWVTISRKLLQVSRMACDWKRWWNASWCVSPSPVVCREMKDVVKFWVLLCNSYFIPSDLCQKHFRLCLYTLQTLRSQNK